MTDRQQLIVNNVDTAKQLILDAERWIWAHPQTGYTEWQAHDYLAEKYVTEPLRTYFYLRRKRK